MQKVINQSILKCSPNAEAQKLYGMASTENVKHDSIINDITSENALERHQVKRRYRSILSKEFKERTSNNFFGLKNNSLL